MPPEVLAPNQHENDPTQEMKTPKDQREAETEGENLSMANDDTDICIYYLQFYLLCILMYLWRGIGWECAEYAWHMTIYDHPQKTISSFASVLGLITGT